MTHEEAWHIQAVKRLKTYFKSQENIQIKFHFWTQVFLAQLLLKVTAVHCGLHLFEEHFNEQKEKYLCWWIIRL